MPSSVTSAAPPAREPLRVPRVHLGDLLRDAAAGRFPERDGSFSRAPAWKDGVEGAIAFTGHAVMVVSDDVSDGELAGLGVHGFGGAHEPRITLALAGDGPIGVLDALLVGHGTGRGGPLVPRPDLALTDRAAHAGEWRTEVDVYGLPDLDISSLATLSRGIGGLPEVGIQAGDGHAATLLDGVLGRLPAGKIVLASVTPGNTRSLRFFLRRGSSRSPASSSGSPGGRRDAELSDHESVGSLPPRHSFNSSTTRRAPSITTV